MLGEGAVTRMDSALEKSGAVIFIGQVRKLSHSVLDPLGSQLGCMSRLSYHRTFMRRRNWGYVEEYAHRRRPRSWQVHFHGLLARVRVSRLSKGKVEGKWFRRLFSRWTCFSVVTPRKAPSEIWEGWKAEVREPHLQSRLS